MKKNQSYIKSTEINAPKVGMRQFLLTSDMIDIFVFSSFKFFA